MKYFNRDFSNTIECINIKKDIFKASYGYLKDVVFFSRYHFNNTPGMYIAHNQQKVANFSTNFNDTFYLIILIFRIILG